MQRLVLGLLGLMVLGASCNRDDGLDPEVPLGSTMLLIGNSFFRPYAEKLDLMAIDAGLVNHNSTKVFRGGDNGRAISFWNDSTSKEHSLIKSTLDQGGIEYFGMTSGYLDENPTDGYREWISYALQNNPDITINH